MTTQIAIRLDDRELAALDAEVTEGRAANRSDAVRRGIARLQRDQRYRSEEAILIDLTRRSQAIYPDLEVPLISRIPCWVNARHRLGSVGQAVSSADPDTTIEAPPSYLGDDRAYHQYQSAVSPAKFSWDHATAWIVTASSAAIPSRRYG